MLHSRPTIERVQDDHRDKRTENAIYRYTANSNQLFQIQETFERREDLQDYGAKDFGYS